MYLCMCVLAAYSTQRTSQPSLDLKSSRSKAHAPAKRKEWFCFHHAQAKYVVCSEIDEEGMRAVPPHRHRRDTEKKSNAQQRSDSLRDMHTKAISMAERSANCTEKVKIICCGVGAAMDEIQRTTKCTSAKSRGPS